MRTGATVYAVHCYVLIRSVGKGFTFVKVWFREIESTITQFALLTLLYMTEGFFLSTSEFIQRYPTADWNTCTFLEGFSLL
jgi:hypothetical protein